MKIHHEEKRPSALNDLDLWSLKIRPPKFYEENGLKGEKLLQPSLMRHEDDACN